MKTDFSYQAYRSQVCDCVLALKSISKAVDTKTLLAAGKNDGVSKFGFDAVTL